MIEGLRKLEYRGYDAARIAVVGQNGNLEIRRAPGKLRNLEEVIAKSPLDGTYGIGHTRWATHGRPTEENAHPHRDCTGKIVVVHNGIIENYLELKEKLQKEGHSFATETDTEIVAHLVEKNSQNGVPLEEAVRRSLKELRGIYALVFLSAKDPKKIVAARMGPPSVIGLGEGEYFVARGTSWHAGLAAKFMIEGLARVPVEVDYGSEFRYRDPIVDSKTLTVCISQSGETADTLAAQREAKTKGSPTLAICNVIGSMITREANGTIPTHAGPEIGVASTKAFTSQMTALLLLASYLGQLRGKMSDDAARKLMQEFTRIPHKIETVLQADETGFYENLARLFFRHTDFLYLGRGIHYPIALEGALKLKEISYIHAEGYPAGEMKHGPNALIDENLPVVVLATRDESDPETMTRYEKSVSNIKEVKARDGIVVSIVTKGDHLAREASDHIIELPPCPELLAPFLEIIPLQLLAYHIAVRLGCDVDQPRNLAKSVTVE